MWGKKCNCEGKWLLLESELKPILLLAQRLETLETSLSSLRGTVNAKLSGEPVQKVKKKQSPEEFRELTPEEQEFINSLPPHELERLNKSDDEEE